jgi:transposase
MGKCGGDEGWHSGFAGRIEVRESATGRREWPEAVKGRIVRESLEPGALVKDVARRHGIAPQQLDTSIYRKRDADPLLPLPI